MERVVAEINRQVEFGRYRLLRPLGRGGMAEVHLAESVGPMNFRKQVAIKRLLPQYATNKRYIQMLLDEAHIAGAINHPNVVQVIDLGNVEGVHFIAMEFVNGLDLAGILQTLRLHQRALPLPIALHMARCVARGLHAAHTLVDHDGQHMRVVHRDVSPHNVLISHDGEVKLIDFGVAKAETNLTMTRSGVIKGKLQYMSPEQAKAEAVDCRADVFSLGMTLYKMLVGRLPFSGTNEFQIYDEILRKKAAPPSTHRPEIPERVDALVLRSLRKHPAERFQTTEEMAVVLDRALDALHPGLGATEVSEWLARELPSEQRFSSPDDDDFRVVEGPTPPPEGSWDDERIERLTRVEEGEVLVPTVRATLDGRSRERRPAAGSPAANQGAGAQEPAQTVQLPAFEPPPVETELSREAVAVPAAGAAPEAPSGASVHTSQLTALRPRKPMWILVGVVATLAVVLGVLLLQESGDAAFSQAAQNPVRMDVNLAATDAPAPPTASSPESRATSLAPASAATSVPVDAPLSAPASAASISASVSGAKPAPAPATASIPSPASAATPAAAAKPPVSAPAVAAAPTRPPEPPTKAWLTVSTLPWAWVHVDGQRLARHTPIVSVPVKPGRHSVRLETGDGRSHTVEVNLRPGQRHTVSHAFK